MPNFVNEMRCSGFVLRTFVDADAEALQQLLAANKQEMLPWVPWAGQEPQTIDEKRLQIRRWQGEFLLDKTYTYGLYSSEQQRLQGVVFLFTRQGEGILEIGYIIDKMAAGQGLATRASYALARLSFEQLDAEKVMILCSPENKASGRIPEKLGFALEGIDTEVSRGQSGERSRTMRWAMFTEDWQRISTYEPVACIRMNSGEA